MALGDLDRRAFAALLPGLLSAAAFLPEAGDAQQGAGTMEHPVMGTATPGLAAGSKPVRPQPELVSGVYTPGAPPAAPAPRTSRRYLNGMLKAGNIQMEIHETHQEVGAVHEAVGKHLHNEIWLVQEGVCELTTNGVTRRMVAGDVGLCCAGDLHYVANAGDTPCTYFVVTVGPPEP